MKTNPFTPILWLGFALFAAGARAQDASPSAPAPAPMPDLSVLPEAPRNPPGALRNAPKPRPDPTRQERNLRFNFRSAPLETVLNYMSDAAGFIIVLETPVRGTVDMWSTQPISKDEAVQLLNVALNKNGYAASVQGRNLIVASKDDAKKRNIPIHTGNDPEEIPPTAEMVMQIIPLRHIDAMQASLDLATLLPGSATLTANQDSNALIVTDTQINVRHIVELVAALDTSGDTVSTMRVFQLKNADPTEMAQLLMNIFMGPTPGLSGGGFQSGQFGLGALLSRSGFPGAPSSKSGKSSKGGKSSSRTGSSGSSGGGGGGGGGARDTPVVAVADPRTFSVIVTASKDMMPEIAEMIAQLDSSTSRKQKVFVYTLENADVKQVESVLKNLFQSNNTRGSTSSQPDPLTTRASSNSQTSGTSSSLSIGSGSSRGR